jgi:hypothetical protein
MHEKTVVENRRARETDDAIGSGTPECVRKRWKLERVNKKRKVEQNGVDVRKCTLT